MKKNLKKLKRFITFAMVLLLPIMLVSCGEPEFGVESQVVYGD